LARAQAGLRRRNVAIETGLLLASSFACGLASIAADLRSTTGPDNTNNVLALAFGVLIVVLVMGGSLWIMANLNHNMMPMDQIMQMQR
jgi:heme/copper-type cytochrome/quinol oxidase subunit 4